MKKSIYLLFLTGLSLFCYSNKDTLVTRSLILIPNNALVIKQGSPELLLRNFSLEEKRHSNSIDLFRGIKKRPYGSLPISGATEIIIASVGLACVAPYFIDLVTDKEPADWKIGLAVGGAVVSTVAIIVYRKLIKNAFKEKTNPILD